MSFDLNLRSALESSCSGGSSVAFVNCQVKCSQQEGAVKIIATSRIKVESSYKKFKLRSETLEGEGSTVMHLSDVGGASVNQLVTVVVKVMDVSAPEEVMMKEGKELYKQECKGVSGYMRVVLRGDSVSVIEGGCSYKKDTN